ncbi:MAG TPA: transposase [Cytophagales bacterium]|nr:transposase [Cytophagales bacterium]HAP63006.1 transposase [Cytophagales bacterium]
MSQYKIRDPEGLYFITWTVVGWVDLFIRNEYRDCLLESFRYCVREKGLRLHAYVIMTSHLHAIVSSEEGHDLVATMRDMKKFTSKKLVGLIQETPESRRVWLLHKFCFEAERTERGQDYILWQQGYHAKQIETTHFLHQKLDYIHENPVAAGFVSRPEDYLYSSARNYCGELGMIEVERLY